jgi:hypothetical protein
MLLEHVVQMDFRPPEAIAAFGLLSDAKLGHDAYYPFMCAPARRNTINIPRQSRRLPASVGYNQRIGDVFSSVGVFDE